MRRIRRHTSPGVYTQITDISAFNMSKYKRFFHEKSDDIEINNGGNTPQPEPQPEPEKYLVFTAKEDNSTIGLKKLSSKQELWYSYTKDTNAEWTIFNTDTTIELTHNGDKVYVRGKLSADITDSDDCTQFKMSGEIAASGNCNAIWDYEDLNAPLKQYCGISLFEGCESLIEAPELPAAILAGFCYRKMFKDCTKLIQVHKLPAETCGDSEQCYSNMFQGCEKLTEAPELPATTLSKNCYKQMFFECSSLTEAPELPATELAENCYESMFKNCTSLTKAPELLAIRLFKKSYYEMFRGCTSLENIKCLATDIGADECTKNWVNEVSSTGTFVKHPDMNNWSTGANGIPSGWTPEDAVL